MRAKRSEPIKVISIVLALLAASGLATAQALPDSARSATEKETEKELIRIAQELFDAIASGNKAPWQKYVADDVIFIYTDENWCRRT